MVEQIISPAGTTDDGGGCIRYLKNGAVLLDHGPLTLTVLARRQGAAVPAVAYAGVLAALDEFERLVAWLPRAKSWIGYWREEDVAVSPRVLQKMVHAVRQLSDPQFTAMAAVAGSFAQFIMEEIAADGQADEVIVNNGGDIALFSRDEQKVFRVGLVNDVCRRSINFQLLIPAGAKIGGIATSGLGGRSLTRGVASAVTVLASNAAEADAAATDIANHTFTQDEQIITCPAQEIDYDTDIRDLHVVRQVGQLSNYVKLAALSNGLKRAKQLYLQGMISGAVIFVQEKFACWPTSQAGFELRPYETTPQGYANQANAMDYEVI